MCNWFKDNHFLIDEMSLYPHKLFNVNKITTQPQIMNVIFNDPATVVFWSDNTKTVVKCQDCDTYSKEMGLAMCICKKYFNNKPNFNNEFKKWIKEEKNTIDVTNMRKKLGEYCKSIGICRNCKLYLEAIVCGYSDSFSHHISDEKIIEIYKKHFENN